MNMQSPDTIIPEGAATGYPSISIADESVKPVVEKKPAAPEDTAAPQQDNLKAQLSLEESFQKLMKSILGDNFLEHKDDNQIVKLHRRNIAMLDSAASIGQKNNTVIVNFGESKKSIETTATKVMFSSPSPKKDFTMDDAMRMAIIASQNKTLIAKGIKLEGTPSQQRMLSAAIQSLNETLLPDDRLTIKNPPSRLSLRAAFTHKADAAAFVDKHAPAQDAIKATDAAPVDEPIFEEFGAGDVAELVDDEHGPESQPIVVETPPVNVADEEKLNKRALLAITKLLSEEKLSTLKADDRLVERRATNLGHNVYHLQQMVKLPDDKTANLDAYYVIKDKKPLIVALAKDGVIVIRNNDIFMKNDTNHPKHAANIAPTTSTTPIVTVSFAESVTVAVTDASFGNGLTGGFASAVAAPVDHAAAVAESSARADAAVKGGSHRAVSAAPTGP